MRARGIVGMLSRPVSMLISPYSSSSMAAVGSDAADAPGRRGRPAAARRARACRRARAPAQHVAHLVHQRVGVPRLRQLAVRASFLTARVVVRLLAGRQDEHRHRAQRRVGLDRRAEIVAGAARHHAVRDDQVGVRALRERQPLVGRARPGHRHVIRARERHGEGFLDRHAVVGDQDALGHRTSELSSSSVEGQFSADSEA